MAPLQDDHDDGSYEQRDHNHSQPILVEVIEDVVAVQPPGCVIQDDRLATGIIDLGDSAVQSLDLRPPFRRVQRARLEVHREHGGRLHLQIGVRGLLQHIAPHEGIVQQGVYLSGAQCFHAFFHGLVHGDLDAGVQILDRLGAAAQRSGHAHVDALQGRKVPIADGHERERRLDEVVRDDALMSGSTLDCAAEGHDDVICVAVEGILQRWLRHETERRGEACVFRGVTHEVNAYADGLARVRIRIEDGAAVGGHAHCQAFPSAPPLM